MKGEATLEKTARKVKTLRKCFCSAVCTTKIKREIDGWWSYTKYEKPLTVRERMNGGDCCVCM